MMKKNLALFALATAALLVSGCSHDVKKKDNATYVARDVDTLYSQAREKLDEKEYKAAGILFDEVERQHPYSIWARRAELMSAFSYYLAKDYPASTASANRFIAIHPGNKDAAYAYYIVAMNYYEQIGDVTRDQKTTEQALDALNNIIARYPNSQYAADARLKVDLVRDHLAGKEMEIGRFYQRRQEWLAATLRFRNVIEKYQTTSHVAEALERQVECYLDIGIPQEAQKAAAVLGANYPGSIWYKRAYTLMQKHPYSPARQG
jgi:outer membrane protein assembly factor BamD